MELRVLGPLQVCVNGVALPLGTRKQQSVLALLAVNHGHVVAVDALVDELWPEGPPASAVPNVRSYAGNLRRLFESTGSGDVRVVRQPGGYVLTGAGSVMDLVAFEEDSRAGEEALARGDLRGTADCFRKALGRWQGSMLAGLARGHGLASRCAAVEEERMVLVERLGETYISLDQPGRAVAVLREHAHAHPLRERAQAALMRALERTGDLAGALSVYTTARKALVSELGIEPGAELRELQRELLDRAGPRGLAGPARTRPVAARRTPRELPPVIGHFVGRGPEANAVLRVIASYGEPARSRPCVVVLHGPGGSGKSALAVRVAHQVGDGFPDGHLYVDMLGSTPGLRPLSAAEALRRLLHGMGVREVDIPAEPADAVALFRSISAAQRLLILVDNARDVQQVEELVPASGQSVVLVTSRHHLPTLDADHRVRLDGLTTPDGLALLTRLVPDQVLDAVVAERITQLCDHLPLAIRVAAGRLAGRPDLSPADLVGRLADRRRCLDELELDGLAVRSCIAVSYEALLSSTSPAARLAARAFRALGLLNVPDFGADVVAAMLAEPNRADLRAALDRLVGAGLLEPLAGARYRLHDLVRLVAIERTEEDDPGTRTTALHRGVAYYAKSLRRVAQILRPVRMTAVDVPEMPAEVLPHDPQNVEQAREWLDTELRCLLAVAEQICSASYEFRRTALFIADSIWDFLYQRYDWSAARRLGYLMQDVGERQVDSEMEAWGSLAVGRGAADFGEWELTSRNLERALELYADLGKRCGVASALNTLGVSAHYRGDHSSALSYLSSCREVVADLGRKSYEALVLNNLATSYGAMGKWEKASLLVHESISRREFGDGFGGASSLINLATIQCVQGDFEGALRAIDEAICIGKSKGIHVWENVAVLTRCEVNLRAGRHRDAMADAEAVLTLARDRQDRYTEGLALHQQAKIWAVIGADSKAARVREESEHVLASIQTRRDPFLETLLNGATIGKADP